MSETVQLDLEFVQEIYKSLEYQDLRRDLFMSVYTPEQVGWNWLGDFEMDIVRFTRGYKLPADTLINLLKVYPSRLDLLNDCSTDIEFSVDAIDILIGMISQSLYITDSIPYKLLQRALITNEWLRQPTYNLDSYKNLVEMVGCPVCLYGSSYPHYIIEPILSDPERWNLSFDNHFEVSKEDQIRLLDSIRRNDLIETCLISMLGQITNSLIPIEILTEWRYTLGETKINFLRQYAIKKEIDLDVFCALSGESIGDYVLEEI